ncbi:hypothetical protein [Halosimplex sp. TS25]|uniref:hypothetical protein n=1 Tax=Halosimplex rarum TaxID=3396619 RepID=UPI0039E83F0C
MARQLAALLVVALVLLSGCNLLGGSSTATPSTPGDATDAATTTGAPTPTPTPAETTTPTPTPTPTPAAGLKPLSSMSLPDGVTSKDVDAGELTSAFMERVSNITYRADVTVENSTGTIWEYHAENDSDASLVTLYGGTTVEIVRWVGPTEAGVYSPRKTAYVNGQTKLRRLAKMYSKLTSFDFSGHVLRVVWDPIGVRTTDEGERVVLNATGLAENVYVYTDGDVVGVSGTVDVTSEGRIVNGTIAYTVDYGNKTDTRTVTIETERASGDFVSKPGWVSDPPQVSAEVTESDKLLEMSLTDGPTIEAGTTLSVNETVFGYTLGTVTLDERLDPGETVYVYRTRENGTATFHASVGERPTLHGNATAFTEDLYLHGRQGDYVFQAGVTIE